MSPHKAIASGNKDQSEKKKARRSRTPKAKDAPRRPLSAYNLYFKYQRALMLAGNDSKSPLSNSTSTCTSHVEKDTAIVIGGSYSGMLSAAGQTVVQPTEGFRTVQETCKRVHKRTHGKVSFADLARKIGQQWRAMDEVARQPFVLQARVERERYREEVTKYRERKKASFADQVAVASTRPTLGTCTVTQEGVETKIAISNKALQVGETFDIEPICISTTNNQDDKFSLHEEIWDLGLFESAENDESQGFSLQFNR